MTAQLVTDALVMAIWRRGKPDALLHHSDRGSQYTSEQFQKLMADHGVVCSMSVNAVSIFLTCAEVKFPRGQVTVISRPCDQELHFCVGARDGAAAVPGSAS